MSYRNKKVQQLLKRQIGEVILKDVNLNERVLITVTHVKVSSDFQHAKVYLSIYPEIVSKKTIDYLTKNIYNIQQIINKRLFMRPVPKIRFVADETSEKLTLNDF